jgi:hypothetical protein
MSSAKQQNILRDNLVKQINNALKNIKKQRRNRAPVNQNKAGLTQALSAINLPKIQNSPVKLPRSLTR